MSDASIQNARNGNRVRGHQSDHLDRDDGVEGRGGPNVDERKEHGDDAGQDNGVLWDLALGIDVPDPSRKGKALVSRESKGLTSGGGIERNVRRNDKNEDNDCERIDSGGRNGRFEDVKKRELGRIVQCLIDVIDGEQIADEKDDGHDAIADITPEERNGHVATCVPHLFGHVSG